MIYTVLHDVTNSPYGPIVALMDAEHLTTVLVNGLGLDGIWESQSLTFIEATNVFAPLSYSSHVVRALLGIHGLTSYVGDDLVIIFDGKVLFRWVGHANDAHVSFVPNSDKRRLCEIAVMFCLENGVDV